MIIYYTECMALAAITANRRMKLTYIPLEWLFFLKDMTSPYPPAFIISADPSSCCKEIQFVWEQNLIKMSLTLFRIFCVRIPHL
jgi:hypothetical protein